ncbi:D-isomer specific 2-hydroxyacid dehydrogenase NAD-binding protein [Acetobacter nitrogenifigens DSM 23921 = NBRC 105050]|uniref:D-3-phosphoglycerate dehydrogenase n=1 Tax=Acetobacter nitrogenifigens DSM 23921 = NBRC 105050 TaxID=1120919 RepID=A0A511X9Z3_9PROT|nr:D-2-hydroxyacid dehydrogenase [Acetobacter nitrogenifigens]GBQ97886.1 D-isomer specific 2-hydroxyacid dehydrogenase NAD-binding protein [Acetobacter nitrogenifigens DSM 23921 = NBRC 105050]GEN59770.1 D-3-phosphoglycerate dehydrogenase [Acetobacter nitrogenifigens DSM 23921 = NBRC 105050]
MSLWAEGKPKIVIAHPFFDIKSIVETWENPPSCVQVSNKTELLEHLPDAEILVTVTLWERRFLALAPQLKLLQSISSGVNQYDLDDFRERGVALCSARGVNAAAVAEHAIGLTLNLSRQLAADRDAQRAHQWRRLSADRALRRRELDGAHAVIVGFGAIGSRLAALCLAFGMRVTVVRQNAAAPTDLDVSVEPHERFADAASSADYVLLTCPATPETIGMLNAAVLDRMKPSAIVINVARGQIIVEADLIAALVQGKIAGAGLDTFEREPLPGDSPLWDMPNVMISPHGAGDTTEYEARVAHLLRENARRIALGESLINQVA